MKRLLFLCFMGLILTSSCQKTGIDLIFGDPNKRIFDTLAVRESALLSSEHGWKTVFSPAGGGTFLFYMQFDDKNRVIMISDFNQSTGQTVKESSYVLRATGQPSLIFDTYNYLHILSHPQNSTSGGSSGEGRISDYEFYFESVEPDKIVLRGVKNNNIMILEKATEEEANFFKSGGIGAIIDEATIAMEGKFLRIEEGSLQTPASIDFTNKTVSIIEIGDNNETTTQNVQFIFSPDADGIDLLTPLNYNGKLYLKIYWDADNKEFYLLDGTNKYVFETSEVPTTLPYTPPFHEMFGQDQHLYMVSRPTNTSSTAVRQTGKFQQILQEDLDRVAAAGRTYAYFSFNLQPNANADITLSVRTASSTYFIGSYYYRIIWIDQANGIFRLQHTGNAGSYAASTLSYSQSLRDVLATHTFKAVYLAISRPDNSRVGGFLSMDDPDIFIMGLLGNAL